MAGRVRRREWSKQTNSSDATASADPPQTSSWNSSQLWNSGSTPLLSTTSTLCGRRVPSALTSWQAVAVAVAVAVRHRRERQRSQLDTIRPAREEDGQGLLISTASPLQLLGE
eukprot:scaffold1829_cov194-Ochromonas_danica.AAC.18